MANGRFGGGNGSNSNPYLIEDAKDLDRIRFNLTASYKLVNNINLDVYPYNVGNGWSPIDGGFLGVLDGNGKKILNLFINRGNETDVGFFRIIANSTTLKSRIRDLAFENATVVGKTYVGILAGKITYAAESITVEQTDYTVNRVTCDGKVTGESYAGIVTGHTVNNTSSTFDWKCMNNVKVSGSLTAKIVGNYYGAVVGYANNTYKVKFANIVIDAEFKRLIGTPKGYSFSQASIGNATMENIYYDNTKWSGSNTIVTVGSTGVSSSDMKRTDTFYAISGEFLTYNNKKISVWVINSGKAPMLYNQFLNNFFILNNGSYYTFKGGKWVAVFNGVTPTREQADKEGIKFLSLINQAAWDQLKTFEGVVELVNIVETSTGVTLNTTPIHLLPMTERHTPTRKFFSKKVTFSDFGQAISEIKTI